MSDKPMTASELMQRWIEWRDTREAQWVELTDVFVRHIVTRIQTIIPDETVCSSCPHTYFDHGGWMSEERRAEVSRHRTIGCRIVGCQCNRFVADYRSEVDKLFIDYGD